MTASGFPRERSAGAWVGIFARGAAMGIAEVVPGVSGGTIAFVTGIYREFITSLAAFSPITLPWVATDPRRFWTHHNLGFLICLGSGMLLSVLLFARLISAAVESLPTLVWGFFFGLVLFSVFDVGRARPPAILATLGVAGLVLGAATSNLEFLDTEPSLSAYFLGGALAVCAWLLPAVSGSFLLLVLGLYTHVLAAAATLDWTILAVFALGMATGLALSAKLLRYLMDRFFEPVLGFLTGFMAGALVKLWPWQAGGLLLLPADWSQVAGAPARVWLTVLMMLLGGASLWLLARARQ